MAWPSTNVYTINNISSVVWRELLPDQLNLITDGRDPLMRVAGRRGAIQPFAGGDKFNVNTIISSGETEVEYDPAAVDPSTTVGTTGYQYVAPAEYKYYARTKNMIFPQDLNEMVSNPRAIADIFRTEYLANMMGMVENLCNTETAPGGFWSTTGVLPSAGLTNAYSMFADATSDFAGVDVSAYTKFKPTLTDFADADGSELLKTGLQKFLNEHAYGSEGGITDIFTTQTAWEKIRSLMIADGILAVRQITDDVGVMNTLTYAGVDIHWSPFLVKDSVWDIAATSDSESPFIGIDFNSVRLRVKPGGGIPGDQFGLFRRLNMPTLSETRVKFFQRLGLIAQWCFTKSRRTSGHGQGLQL